MSATVSASKKSSSFKEENPSSKPSTNIAEKTSPSMGSQSNPRPSFTGPKYSGGLFFLSNNDYDCFGSDKPEAGEEYDHYNKFFKDDSGAKTEKTPNAQNSESQENDPKKKQDSNFIRAINDAKSDLDTSEVLSRQNSLSLDPKGHNDKLELVDSKAILGIFAGSYSDDEEDKQNSIKKTSQQMKSQESKGYNKNNKKFQDSEDGDQDEEGRKNQAMIQLQYMQNQYNSRAPYFGGMVHPQGYNMMANANMNGMNGMAMMRYQVPMDNYYPVDNYSGDNGSNNNKENHRKYSSRSGNGNGKNRKKQNGNNGNKDKNQKYQKNKQNEHKSEVDSQVTTETEELEQTLENFSEMAKDQNVCRFLQKKLELNNPALTSRIFEKVITEFNMLTTDPFGNYLCQKLMESCSKEELGSIIEILASELVSICLNSHGTRAAQKLIEVVSEEDHIQLIVESLSKDVVKLIKDNNGNHVIQRCLTHLKGDHKQFIYDAIMSNCIEVATHKHGCCVIQRCLDYASEKQKAELISVIVENALELVQDQYGNYVVQYILDLKDIEFKVVEDIAEALSAEIANLSKQKFASNVVEKCLQLRVISFREAFMELIVDDNILVDLLCDEYANYVLQRYLSNTNEEESNTIIQMIQKNIDAIRVNPLGQKILSKLCKNYPQLNGSDTASNPSHTSQISHNEGQNQRKNSQRGNNNNNNNNKQQYNNSNNRQNKNKETQKNNSSQNSNQSNSNNKNFSNNRGGGKQNYQNQNQNYKDNKDSYRDNNNNNSNNNHNNHNNNNNNKNNQQKKNYQKKNMNQPNMFPPADLNYPMHSVMSYPYQMQGPMIPTVGGMVPHMFPPTYLQPNPIFNQYYNEVYYPPQSGAMNNGRFYGNFS